MAESAVQVIMAQIGCRIPCTSARIGVVDYIGTRFGANDEIARGRSVSALLYCFQTAKLISIHL